MADLMAANLELKQEARLDKARHLKYWSRCLKTHLPHHYTSFDSNRMYLGYFTLAALDLLDSLHTITTDEERRGYADWIYSCQHASGGFRMWKGTMFGERASEENAKWDPANVAATYFALVSLLILEDDFRRVQRRKTLNWLRTLQREDGSFGEFLMDGHIEGGRDPRQGYCAAGIRHILRGNWRPGPLKGDGEDIEDIGIDQLVRCVRAAESFDGGIADEPFHEPHAGYTFCSLGAMSFLDRLNTSHEDGAEELAPSSAQQVLHWLVSRQTEAWDPDAPEDGSDDSRVEDSQITQQAHQSPEKSIMGYGSYPMIECAGMNGRINKVADTCYAFWVGASLHLMKQPHLYDQQAVQRYLLEMTQHPVLGGFGKFPGDLPDLYHSYMGLVAYSLAGGEGVLEANAGMCTSQRVSNRLLELWKGWDNDRNAS